VLLIDASESMRARVESERAAAAALLDALRPEDAVMVASFAGRTLVHCEWTHDRAVARDAIVRVKPGGRGTRLYDALDVVLAERVARVQGRKVVVLLTDGLDVDSEWATGRSVLERLQAADAAVYALQFDTSPDRTSGAVRVLPKGVRVENDATAFHDDEQLKAQANLFLDTVTRASGGRVVRAAMPDDIARAFEGIADEVRQQMVLYYYPAGAAAANSFHAIRVETKRPGVTVRTRTGYRSR
jgi:VWFA-related protein